MKSLQSTTDKLAIGLSLACAFHCLALPIILVALPNIAAMQLDNEAFHTWLLVAVLPTSLIALSLGCKKHKRTHLIVLGSIGLALLVGAVVVGEHLMGEMGEKLLTASGSIILIIGHMLNYRLCLKTDCGCSKKDTPGSSKRNAQA